MITKEEAESLGWIYRPDTFARERGLPLTHYWMTKDGFGMTISVSRDHVHITDDRVDTMFANTILSMDLPNIDDLKDIMRILKIN